MLLLILYILLAFGLWYTDCVKQPWKGNNITNIQIQNRNKIPFFVYNNYLQKPELKNYNTFSSYNNKFNTPNVKIKPSVIFSKVTNDNVVENNKNKYKELVDPKNALSGSKVKFTPLASLVSLVAYLLPFIMATESFFRLLVTMDLPVVLQKFIKTSVMALYTISSVPNLMDFVQFFLYSFLLKKKDLIKNRFIKFNLAQGSIIYFYNSLLSRIYSYFIQPLGDGLVATSLGYTLLFSTFVPLIYCMTCALLGKYSQLPVISEAAYLNVSNDSFKI